MPQIELIPHLEKIVKQHVNELGEKGCTTATFNQNLKDRITANNGNVLEHFGFNINLHADTPIDIICMMLVDDGIEKRSRRLNLFHPNMKKGAVAFADHRDLDKICGIVLC